jgi:zinc transport system substrate-binding protein
MKTTLCLAAALAAGAALAADPAPLATFASVAPQTFFVQRVGGAAVRCEALVAPGQDPHTFEPLPRQMARLSAARLYFTIGLPFEAPLLEKARAVAPGLTVVDMAAGIARRPLELHARGEAEAEGRHDEEGELDPHVWLNPRLAKALAANAGRALQQAEPGRADEFARNRAALEQELDEADARLARRLAPYKGRAFLVFHPAFAYFADAYGLRQIAVEIEGKEPSAQQMTALIELARRERVRVVFAQPHRSDRTARTIAESIGGRVVPLNDLAPDYLANLDRMGAALEEALRETSP